MKAKFSHYPIYAKILILIYAVNITFIASYRLIDIFNNGVVLEGTAAVLDFFSLFMNIAAPVAIYLLFANTKLGLWIILGSIMALFIYDAFVLFSILGSRYTPEFYFYEIAFSVFVFFTVPIVQFMTKTKQPSREYA
ncbi:MAG: hypothetical protein WBA23_02655 [Tunicatimonas sp.]|uniref:hypothetical protein n=1 Tax=Tunicatimonas sp. TaxID=1940096 RepID=UPI003C7871E4